MAGTSSPGKRVSMFPRIRGSNSTLRVPLMSPHCIISLVDMTNPQAPSGSVLAHQYDLGTSGEKCTFLQNSRAGEEGGEEVPGAHEEAHGRRAGSEEQHHRQQGRRPGSQPSWALARGTHCNPGATA